MTANFPANIAFASYLTYDPRGDSDEARKSRDFTYSVKQDGSVGTIRTIDGIIERILFRLEQFPFLRDFLNPKATLIPMPRSAPLKPSTLWVPKRICDSLVSAGLGAETLACIERFKAVTKSSTAGSRRPSPEEHFSTTRILNSPTFPLVTDIVLIDDVLTRGSTFVGVYPHIQRAFPSANIKCFALVSTRGLDNFRQILDPVQGTITYDSGSLDRVP